MKKSNLISLIVLLPITFIVIICVGLYFLHFHNDFSTDSTHWADFGSYIEGSLGPTLSALSILVVMYFSSEQIKQARESTQEQIKQAKDCSDKELKTVRLENEIRYLKNCIEDCRKNFRQRNISYNELRIVGILVSEHLDNKKTASIDANYSFYINEEEQFIFSDITSLLYGLELILPTVKIETIFSSKELGFLLTSRGALATEILGHCAKLAELCDDRHLINATVNEIHKECLCLYKYNILELSHIKLLKKILALPAHITLEIQPMKEILKTLADITNEKILCVIDSYCEFNKDRLTYYYLFTIKFPEKSDRPEECWQYSSQRWKKILSYHESDLLEINSQNQ